MTTDVDPDPAGADVTTSGGPELTAVIGDLAGSRDLDAGRRRRVQDRFGELLDGLSRAFAASVAARFTITVGDEFQGVLSDPGVLPRILWRLEVGLTGLRLWTGVGHGAIETEMREEAIGMDGPAFHRARSALEEAKSSGRHGGVFSGFGEDDPVLDGLARLLEHHRTGLTEAQTEAVELVREGLSQRAAADRLGVTPQAVSKRLRAAGWDTLREGEEALAALLERWASPARREDRS